MFNFRPTLLLVLLFVAFSVEHSLVDPLLNVEKLGYPQQAILQVARIHSDRIAILTNQNTLLIVDQKNTLLEKLQTCSARALQIKKNLLMLRAKPFSEIVVIQVDCKQSSIEQYKIDIEHGTIEKIKVESELVGLEQIYQINDMIKKQSRILLDCGNGKIDANETCDDGNKNSSDGCSSSCTKEYCGDGIINNGASQQCDDGNTKNNDGCSSQCIIQCGNLKLDGNQTCDDGNRKDGDGCSAQCKTQQNSIAIPLAVGIPIATIALVGIGVAGASAAQGGATAASQGVAGVNYISVDNPPKVLEIEEAGKIMKQMER